MNVPAGAFSLIFKKCKRLFFLVLASCSTEIRIEKFDCISIVYNLSCKLTPACMLDAGKFHLGHIEVGQTLALICVEWLYSIYLHVSSSESIFSQTSANFLKVRDYDS